MELIGQVAKSGGHGACSNIHISLRPGPAADPGKFIVADNDHLLPHSRWPDQRDVVSIRRNKLKIVVSAYTADRVFQPSAVGPGSALGSEGFLQRLTRVITGLCRARGCRAAGTGNFQLTAGG